MNPPTFASCFSRYDIAIRHVSYRCAVYVRARARVCTHITRSNDGRNNDGESRLTASFNQLAAVIGGDRFFFEKQSRYEIPRNIKPRCLRNTIALREVRYTRESRDREILLSPTDFDNRWQSNGICTGARHVVFFYRASCVFFLVS